MAENQETIGAKFTIDVNDLKNGITEANRTIRVAQSEFKAAAAGMDDWRNSETGLEAKLKSLNTTADMQAAKVQALAQEHARLVSEQGETSAAAQNTAVRLNNATAAYNKTQKEIDQTSAALDEFRSGANQAGDAAQQAGSDAESSGGGFSNLADLVKDSAGQLAAFALAAAGLSSAGDYLTGASSGAAQLNAALGATGDRAAEFDAVLQNMYANNYGASFEDLAESASRVVQVMGNDISPAALESVTTSAIALSDTFDMDVSESAKAAQVMMNNFGMTSEQAFDMIAAGAQQGLNVNDDMLDSFSEYSPYFAQIGLDANDMFNAFAAGSEISMYGVDKAGDAFKEFGIRVVDGSTTTQEAFNSMGLNMDEYAAKIMQGGDTAATATSEIVAALLGIDDPVQRNIAGVNLFGTQWEDLGQTGAESMLSLMGAANETAGAMQQVDSIRYDNIGDSLSSVGRAIQDSVLSPLVDQLTPAVSDFAADAIPKIQDFGTWANENLPTIGLALTGIAGGLAGFAAASAVQTAVGAFQAFKAATEGVTLAQTLMNAVMAANPIGIIVAAVTALVAGLIYLWNTNEGFRDAVTNAWNMIVAGVSAAVDAIVNFFTVTVPAGIDAMLTFFSNLPTNIANFLTMVISNVASWASNMASNALQAGSQFLSNVTSTISGVPGAVMGFLSGLLSRVGGWIGSMASSAANAGSRFLSSISSSISGVPSAVMGVLNGIPSAVSGFAGRMASAAGDMVRGMVSGITSAGGAVWSAITNVCSNALGAVKSFFGIASPSKLMKKMFGYVGDGMAIGLTDSIPTINKAVAKVNAAATPSVDANVNVGASGTAGAGGGGTTFVQNNYSPKALDARDAYREGLKLTQMLAMGV